MSGNGNSGWNRSTGNQPTEKKVGAKVPSVWKGIVAGLVTVCALGAVCVWLFSGDSGEEAASAKKERGRIKAVTPAAAPKAVEEPKVEKPKKPNFWEVKSSQTNGFSEAMQRKWRAYHRPPPCYTNKTSWTDPKPAYMIFNHASENRIATYIAIEPGTTLVGTPRWDESFKRDFLKSCEEPILTTDEDTEEQKQLKKTMTQVKIELRQRMANGEDLGDIMAETHKEMQKLGQLKNEIENLMRQQLSESTTAEDANDIIAAANKMLEDKGIAPLKMNPILQHNIERIVQRNSQSNQQE